MFTNAQMLTLAELQRAYEDSVTELEGPHANGERHARTSIVGICAFLERNDATRFE